MIKKSILITSLLFAIIFIYANTRFINPSARLEPIDVGTFEFEPSTDIDSIGYMNELQKIVGIHGISLQFSARTIGITYEYQKIPKEELVKSLSLNNRVKVNEVRFNTSNSRSCPVHGALGVAEEFLNSLRILR